VLLERHPFDRFESDELEPAVSAAACAAGKEKAGLEVKAFDHRAGNERVRRLRNVVVRRLHEQTRTVVLQEENAADGDLFAPRDVDRRLRAADVTRHLTAGASAAVAVTRAAAARTVETCAVEPLRRFSGTGGIAVP